MNTLTQETKLTLFYIFIAYSFSVAMRMIWIYNFNGFEPFIFNSQFMINTNDGYYWAEATKDILSGSKNFSDNLGPAQLTAFFAYVLPFSFESIIFYLPVFLGSLIVVPIILIAKDLKNLEMGLIAALLASISWSYYSRTMAGYYDTDMLNIVLPMFLLWSIILAINTQKNMFLLITAADILIYRWWYPQSYSLEFAFFGLILFYTLIFDRKNFYNYKLLAIMMLAMIDIDGFIRVALVLTAYFLFQRKILEKYIYLILVVFILLFAFLGGFDRILFQLHSYVFTDTLLAANGFLGLEFFSAAQTIREAADITFEVFVNRVSGHLYVFSISFLGYLWLVYRHPVMLFSLPILGLGFLAFFAGLRFVIYAVPIMAMGAAFFITEISLLIKIKKLRYALILFLLISILYPNYKHITEYNIPTVFIKDEVDVLDKLKKVAKKKDYTIAWWDYGYPIRYYSDTKTLIDGGKHTGAANFPVSFILTNPQLIAAKMARLEVEYVRKRGNSNKLESNIEKMTKDYGYKNPKHFISSLKENIKLPQKTRDIYLYLPYRMMNIYVTISMFSNLDLMGGTQKKNPYLYVSTNFREDKKTLYLNKKMSIEKSTMLLKAGNKIIPIKRFIKTFYDGTGKLKKQKKENRTGFLSVIYMKSHNAFLIMDEEVYNSLYIQLMVLEEYDESLFEILESNKHAKVYKLKI